MDVFTVNDGSSYMITAEPAKTLEKYLSSLRENETTYFSMNTVTYIMLKLAKTLV